MTFIEIGCQFEGILPTVQLFIANLLDLGVCAGDERRGLGAGWHRVQIVDDFELIFEVQAVHTIFRDRRNAVEPINGSLRLGDVRRGIDGGGEHVGDRGVVHQQLVVGVEVIDFRHLLSHRRSQLGTLVILRIQLVVQQRLILFLEGNLHLFQ